MRGRGYAAVVLMLRDAKACGAGWVAPAALVGGVGFVWRRLPGVSRETRPASACWSSACAISTASSRSCRDERDPKQRSLYMVQAGVEQSEQFQAPERRMELACGYNEASGVGLALAHKAKRRSGAPLRIGIVGLGAGMIAALGREGDRIRYYELNPAMLDLANRHFTFLRDGKAQTEVLLGDGRLVLGRELETHGSQAFDVLVLNAFRGAAPPMHLMTKEAFDIYLGHLAEGGILAVNFELDTFEMAPLHRGMARRFATTVRWFETKESEGCEGAISWALYTQGQGLLRGAGSEKGDVRLARPPQVRAGVDRHGQQSDEHHQLARGLAGALRNAGIDLCSGAEPWQAQGHKDQKLPRKHAP